MLLKLVRGGESVDRYGGEGEGSIGAVVKSGRNDWILWQCFISCREDAEAADNGDGGGGGGGQTRQGPHSHAAQGGSRSGIPP